MQDNVKYFEDLSVGYQWSSHRRTITETDIVMFAGLSGDYNPLHVDEIFAKETMFGKRIAHGLLGLSILSGLPTTEPLWSVMAFMGLDWKFVAPIFAGDTVHYRSEIVKMRPVSSGDRGIVILKRQLFNQKEEVVQEGQFTLMIKSKGKGSKA